MPTPPDQPVPPVRKPRPMPRRALPRPPSIVDALKASIAQANDVVKAHFVRDLCKAGGSANAADVAIVAREVQKLPLPVLLELQKAGCKVVVCRNSVVDHRPDLKSVRPRGWKPGQTWDTVPGTYSVERKEIVIAVIGHGTKPGPHYPAPGERHGSASLLVHEMYHAIDRVTNPPRSESAEFNKARDGDRAVLTAYERQKTKEDGERPGRQETYAESAARFFAGGHGDATKYDDLNKYWTSNGIAPRDESRPTHGGKR
jgi:hypothetical protein